MNRDMDVIRAIALAVADSTTLPISGVDGLDEATFAAHAQWMQEAGLVMASLIPDDSLETARSAVIWRLTWAGCDFAAAVRSNTLWAKAKTHVFKPAASWTFGALLDWLKGQIGEQLGNIAS